jgi:hypothetical protein
VLTLGHVGRVVSCRVVSCRAAGVLPLRVRVGAFRSHARLRHQRRVGLVAHVRGQGVLLLLYAVVTSPYFADVNCKPSSLILGPTPVAYTTAGLHRQGHTIAAFWAMHSVHHSSEEYNLAAGNTHARHRTRTHTHRTTRAHTNAHFLRF